MHIEVLQHTQDIVMTHIVQPMGNLRNFKWGIKLLTTFQTLQKILTWITNPTRYIDKCQNILLQIAIAKQTVHRLDIDINTLVAELVSTTGRNNECIIVQVGTHQCIGYIEQTLSCFLTFLGEC